MASSSAARDDIARAVQDEEGRREAARLDAARTSLGDRPAACARRSRKQEHGDWFCDTCWRAVPPRTKCAEAVFGHYVVQEQHGKRLVWAMKSMPGSGG